MLAAAVALGEKMIFSVIYGIAKMVCFLTMDYVMDTTFNIQCKDNDVLASPAMPLVLSLQQCIQNEGCRFRGRILLQGHKKTTGTAYKLGILHNSSSNSTLSIHSTGKNLIFIIDLVIMFYVLEKHPRMPPLERGQRALSILTIYAMIGTDYITTNGVSYKDAFEALFSPQF